MFHQMHIFTVRNLACVHFIDYKPFFDDVNKFGSKMDLMVTVFMSRTLETKTMLF